MTIIILNKKGVFLYFIKNMLHLTLFSLKHKTKKNNNNQIFEAKNDNETNHVNYVWKNFFTKKKIYFNTDCF